MVSFESRRIISRPFTLEWAGWRSTTAYLQKHGWEFSEEYDMSRLATRLAFRHREYQMYGYTRYLDIDAYQLDAQSFSSHAHYDTTNLIFRVAAIASHLTVRVIDNFSDFRPVDMSPQFVSEEMKDIEDFRIFAPLSKDTEEFVVNPNDIGDLLQMIREAQTEEQLEIYERKKKEVLREGLELKEFKPFRTPIAQLVKVA